MIAVPAEAPTEGLHPVPEPPPSGPADVLVLQDNNVRDSAATTASGVTPKRRILGKDAISVFIEPDSSIRRKPRYLEGLRGYRHDPTMGCLFVR
jgi:hypothetical protein